MICALGRLLTAHHCNTVVFLLSTRSSCLHRLHFPAVRSVAPETDYLANISAAQFPGVNLMILTSEQLRVRCCWRTERGHEIKF